MSNDSVAQRHLKKYNPYVVRLFDREGERHENFQFFDGGTNLVTLPMSRFDGYPLENEYWFFVPFIVLVVVGVVLPILPLSDYGSATGWAAGVYLAGVAVMGVWAAFHLTNVRATYIAANTNIHNIDFASKAEAVRSLIHTFKRIVRWRRFMRYSMNLGLVSLMIVATWATFFKQAHHGLDSSAKLISLGLFAASAVIFWLFELGRVALTEGMDPTLALVHMVEELGNQLLARNQFVVRNG
jgi:hypothetical protein